MRTLQMFLISVTSAGLFAAAGCAGKEGDRDTTESPASEKPVEPAAPEPESAAPAPAADEPATPAPEPAAPAPALGQPEAEPAPSGAAPRTVQECGAAGGSFVPSIGGHPTCPDGKKSIGAIRHGIEGGICCK